MRRAYWCLFALVVLTSLLAGGCGAGSPAAPTPPAAASTAESQPANIVSASAVVEPARHSSLAFLLGAPVKEVLVKAGDRVSAGQPLIVLDTPGLSSAVTAAEAELKSAQANAAFQRMGRKKWTGSKFVYVSSPPEWKQRADARVAQAAAALEVAKANLAQATLLAPYDGTLVSVEVVPGEIVAAQQTVAVIGDLGSLQVATTDLSEREVARVQIGQPAQTRLKAFGQDLPGKVTAIAPLAQVSNGDTVFKVTILLDQPPADLMWGMTGDVSIQVGK